MNDAIAALPLIPIQHLMSYKDRMETQHQKHLAKMIEYTKTYNILSEAVSNELLTRQKNAKNTLNLFDLSPLHALKVEPVFNNVMQPQPKRNEDEATAAKILCNLRNINRNEPSLRYWDSSSGDDEPRIKKEPKLMQIKQESVAPMDLGSMTDLRSISDLSNQSQISSLANNRSMPSIHGFKVKMEQQSPMATPLNNNHFNLQNFPFQCIDFDMRMMNQTHSNNNHKQRSMPTSTSTTSSSSSSSRQRGQHKCTFKSCAYRTNNYAHLTKHIRTHTGDRPFKCKHPGCDKAFKQKSNLKTHSRIHSGEKPFECRTCGNRFTQRSSLVQHERIHTGIKPFACPVCNKAFKRKDHLHSHLRVHTGEKKHACDWSGCPKRFATPQQLRLHKMDHTGERPFGCHQCGKAFKTRSLLNRHKNIHLKIKPYQCTECEKRFTRKCHVKNHKCKGKSVATDDVYGITRMVHPCFDSK